MESNRAVAWYVAEGQRAEQLLDQGRVSQATDAFNSILERLGRAPSYGRAVILGRLGRCVQIAGRPDLAAQHIREALDILGQLAPSDGVKSLRGTLRSDLGDALRAGGQYEEARKAYEAALKIAEELKDLRGQGVDLGLLAALALTEGKLEDALTRAQAALRVFQHLDPASQDTWRCYGLLAAIIDKKAPAEADDEQRTALEMQVRDFRELQQRAPIVSATLARIGEAPSYGRAVILWQLGRCFHMGRRPDLAVACVREAVSVTERLEPSDGLQSLRGALLADLGEVAPKIAEVPRNEGAAFDVTLYDELTTHYVFETDLLVDGPRERRIAKWSGVTDPVSAEVRPVLVPCARTWIDDEGAIRFGLPQGEPTIERHPGCTIMRRIRREVAVSGTPGVLWQLISGMDGARTSAQILSTFPAGDRDMAGQMLSALTATGVVDVSGRPVGRFLHLATKKGVLPAGGLEGDEVLRLATDGSYREYPGAPRMAVSEAIPARLGAFHSLTRARRSHRDYRGAPLSRSDFDSLLNTACGVTGVLPWAGREVKLRAYPSSGALYAVEIYPVVLRVEGLDAAVYHYRAIENVLEVAKRDFDPARLVGAALPVERAMVAGAAALFCLAGCFPRHEQKYGQGGYRMLVAEAGHISQNLVLAATALGLSARPFGGVFDQLLNHDLGLDGSDEQFLLAVVVGHTGDGALR